MKKSEAGDIIIRESIILLFSVGAFVIAARLAGHDVMRPFYMKALRGFKKYSQSQADAWQKAADAAATAYNQAKL